jgi:cell division protein FtsZ
VDANIIFGAVIDDALGDEVRVTVIAAGLDENRNGRAGGSAESGGTAFSSTSSFGGFEFGTSPASSAPKPGFSSSAAGSGSAPAPPAAPPPARAPEASRWASDEAPGASSDAELRLGRDNGLPAMAVGLLGAPVPADAGEPDTAAPEPSRDDAVVSEDASYSSASYSSISRPAHAELGKTFDVASTRRRPVVFEEDDDLDVPDFLK